MSKLRLINFLEDPYLNGLRYEMGAQLVRAFSRPTKIRLLDDEAILRLGKEGIDVDSFSEIKVESDSTLSYKGKRVIVYIRDVAVMQGKPTLPRFHFAYCQTLDSMQRNKKWGRYVVANRDDGVFLINLISNSKEPRTERLSVCQNCLCAIGWNGFGFHLDTDRRRRIVENFTLAEFFKEYPKDLLSVIPTHTVDTAPVNDYSEDWGMISEAFKVNSSFSCDECGIELVGVNKKYLHVHHIDGQKNNNQLGNLRALCIRCHARMPMHGHLRGTAYYAEFIQKFPG